MQVTIRFGKKKAQVYNMLRQKFLVQFGSQFIIKIVGMVAGIVVARIAGPEVVGTIAFGTAYVSIFGFITGLFSTGHIKAISEGRELGKCVSTYTLLQGSSIALYAIVVAGWFVLQKYVLHYEFESTAQQLVIPILLVAHVADLILGFGDVTFTAKLEIAKANYPKFVKTILWQIGRVVVVILGFRAVGLASWNMIITILTIPLAWRFLKGLPWGGFSKELARQYWLIAVPVFLLVVINSLIAYSDKLLLAHFTSVEELGYYSAAFAIGGMFLLISRAVGMIFFPLFSKLIQVGQWTTLNQKIQTFHNFISLFIFPALCVLAIAGEPFLITILGERYRPSVDPFVILLFATYVEILGMPYGNILSGMGKFYTGVIINVVKLLFFVAFLFFFISPDYLNLGATGLALNLLVVNFITNSLYVIISKYYGSIVFDSINFFRHLVISVLMLGAFYIVNSYNLNVNYYWILTAAIVLMVSYIVLFLLRLMKKSDIIQARELMNFRKTRDYVKDEVNNRNK